MSSNQSGRIAASSYHDLITNELDSLPPGFLQMKTYSESQLVSAQPLAPLKLWLKLPPAQFSKSLGSAVTSNPSL